MTADDEDIPIPDIDPAGPTWTRSPADLEAVIDRLLSAAQAHRGLLEQLHERLSQLEAQEDAAAERPARWLTFPAPPAAEDPPYEGETPLFTIAHFVTYYNEVYVGRPGSPAVPIPDCWLNHPALLAELATLTYTWRAAHLGKHPHPRDAQHWHDRWRPAFAERLASEWTHPHCLTEIHKPAGAPSKTDRYTVETETPDTERSTRAPGSTPG